MDDIQANSQTKKGGTVVPPSDFQSDTTKCADNKAFQESSSRPCGRCACVRTRAQVKRLFPQLAKAIAKQWASAILDDYSRKVR